MQRKLLTSAIMGASLLFAGQTFAAGYYVDEQSAIDMGIQHTLKQERDMYSTASGTVLDGKMTTEVTSFALGLRVAI